MLLRRLREQRLFFPSRIALQFATLARRLKLRETAIGSLDFVVFDLKKTSNAISQTRHDKLFISDSGKIQQQGKGNRNCVRKLKGLPFYQYFLIYRVTALNLTALRKRS